MFHIAGCYKKAMPTTPKLNLFYFLSFHLFLYDFKWLRTVRDWCARRRQQSRRMVSHFWIVVKVLNTYCGMLKQFGLSINHLLACVDSTATHLHRIMHAMFMWETYFNALKYVFLLCILMSWWQACMQGLFSCDFLLQHCTFFSLSAATSDCLLRHQFRLTMSEQTVTT